MHNFLKRSLSGITYVLIIGASVLLHPYLFFGIFSIVQFFLLKEFRKLLEPKGFSFNLVLNYFAGFYLFSVSFSASIGWIDPILAITVIPLLLLIPIYEIIRKSTKPTENTAASMLAFIYISIPFALINLLVFPVFTGKDSFYPPIFMGILIIIWLYDTGAYLVGSLTGKHKLLKRISPKKSWEGVIGGGVITILTSILIAVVLQSPDLQSWLGIAIIAVVSGTAGDLFESLLKRNAGVKDSGNIMPGHGGLLDRFDSMLFVIPPVTVWLILSGKFLT